MPEEGEVSTLPLTNNPTLIRQQNPAAAMPINPEY